MPGRAASTRVTPPRPHAKLGPVETAPQPGSVLGERYRLIRPLARGGMGSVWRAEHLALNSEVAVKIIDPRVAEVDMGLPRFLREARALATLHSPHIVQVIDFGAHGETAYLVMELLEGRTLGQRLKSGGKLSAGETCRILRDVCKAMSHAHDRGIVHRDLKPDNIFLCDASREHVVKVLDFGIAKAAEVGATSNIDTGAGGFLGTPSYMSPEQCRGLKVDKRSDLWALGAIAYECLAGKRLFPGEVVGEIVLRICAEELPDFSELAFLPPAFGAWLRRALARDPGERFQSAAQLFEALTSALDGATHAAGGVDSAETLPGTLESGREQAQSSKPPSTLSNGSLEKSARRSTLSPRKPWLAALVSAVVIAVFAVVAFIRIRAAPPSSDLRALGSAEPAVSASLGNTRAHGTAPAIAPSPLDRGRAAASAMGSVHELADAGASESSNHSSRGLEAPARSLLSKPPAPRTKPSVTRQKKPPEMELLRRKR
jgi:serine/threonine protein kinase